MGGHLRCRQASQNHGMLDPGGPFQPLMRVHLPHQMLSSPPKQELLISSLRGTPPAQRGRQGAQAGTVSSSGRVGGCLRSYQGRNTGRKVFPRRSLGQRSPDLAETHFIPPLPLPACAPAGLLRPTPLPWLCRWLSPLPPSPQRVPVYPCAAAGETQKHRQTLPKSGPRRPRPRLWKVA